MNLSDLARKRLSALREDLIVTEIEHFDQNDCSICVIGNGIRYGLINGFEGVHSEWGRAARWLLDDDWDLDRPYTNEHYYLFGAKSTVEKIGKEEGLPTAADTLIHFLTRLDALLEESK